MTTTMNMNMSPLHHAIASLVLIITILVKHDGILFSNAFHINARHRTAAATARCRAVLSSRTQIFSKVENDETSTDDNKTSSTMTLNLIAETSITSNLAPMTNNDKSLRDFFALPQSAELLMRGSKNNQVQELESIGADLLEQYQKGCERVNALPPTSDDRFFDVTTSGVKFPGMEIMSVATIGVKITNQNLPCYEFVLIRDSTYAQGNRLFVWFFNKVTGKDKDINKDEPSSSNDGQTTSSLNRIRVVPAENDMISFESNANLRIQVQFPALLMKAIPGATKEKSEKTGGDSLRKVLEDDCPVALEAFRQEYVRWLES